MMPYFSRKPTTDSLKLGHSVVASRPIAKPDTLIVSAACCKDVCKINVEFDEFMATKRCLLVYRVAVCR